MREDIPQDVEGVGDNDRRAKDDKGYQEVGRRNKYDIDKGRRNSFKREHQ